MAHAIISCAGLLVSGYNCGQGKKSSRTTRRPDEQTRRADDDQKNDIVSPFLGIVELTLSFRSVDTSFRPIVEQPTSGGHDQATMTDRE